MKRDFLTIADWSAEELRDILEFADNCKATPGNYRHTLEGRSIALIFEKPSLRTHVTFDVGVKQLGAHPVYLTQADINLGKRESIYDTAKNLERWVDAIVIRTFAHATCAELAKHASIPVINALTDHAHPCQAVGDIMTIIEKFGALKGRKLAYIGDGNNVCNSTMLIAAKLGMDFVAATPRGYAPDMNVFKAATAAAHLSGSTIDLLHNPKEAAKNADVIYTDVWASMGQENEKEQRAELFRDFQVNEKLMSLAKPKAIFMHCLPAHRGEEVTDGVMDSPQSVVFDQAENRLHSQKAIVFTLLKDAVSAFAPIVHRKMHSEGLVVSDSGQIH